MSRILALDWGEKRIGTAISDESQTIAQALDQVVEAKDAIEEIKKIIQELNVERIVVGLPKGLANQDTRSTEKTKKFIAELQSQIPQPIEFLDERFSSIAAGKTLSEQGVKEKDQRQIKDNIAAQIMLQQYLDTKNN